MDDLHGHVGASSGVMELRRVRSPRRAGVDAGLGLELLDERTARDEDAPAPLTGRVRSPAGRRVSPEAPMAPSLAMALPRGSGRRRGGG
jgi:hypothetical protein